MNAVVMVDKNWGIGIKGDQMVFNKEDLKNYNKLTVGNTVVMGYTTLVSLPKGPLKDRKTIVFYDKYEDIEGVEVVHSLDEFLELAKKHGDIYVSGGASIYKLLLPYCKYAYVTKLDKAYEVDTYFPNLDEMSGWVCKSQEKGKFGEGTTYCIYENVNFLSIGRHSEWEEIKTKEDTAELHKTLNRFHDGCFRELHVWSGTYIDDRGLHYADKGLMAKVLFHTSYVTGINAVEILFNDIKRINVPEMKPRYSHIILDSTLKFEDGVFYWADEADWDIKDPRSHEILWIAAKGLKWREKPGWQGKTLRYGIDD